MINEQRSSVHWSSSRRGSLPAQVRLRHDAEVAAAKLLEAVWDAGGEPLVVHPTALEKPRIDTLAERFWMADAVLLPGGGDVSRAGTDRNHIRRCTTWMTQDAFDLALARWAIRDHIPLLAICRGNQVVNVALGGTLVQDMTEEIGRSHRQFVHDIELDAASLLREVVTDDRITICARTTNALTFSATDWWLQHAADDIIEAVAPDGHEGWYLGLQWHLEDFADTDLIQHDIFRAFARLRPGLDDQSGPLSHHPGASGRGGLSQQCVDCGRDEDQRRYEFDQWNNRIGFSAASTRPRRARASSCQDCHTSAIPLISATVG